MMRKIIKFIHNSITTQSEQQRDFKKGGAGVVPIVAQWLTNLPRSHEVTSSIPDIAQRVEVSCGVVCRRGSDP